VAGGAKSARLLPSVRLGLAPSRRGGHLEDDIASQRAPTTAHPSLRRVHAATTPPRLRLHAVFAKLRTQFLPPPRYLPAASTLPPLRGHATACRRPAARLPPSRRPLAAPRPPPPRRHPFTACLVQEVPTGSGRDTWNDSQMRSHEGGAAVAGGDTDRRWRPTSPSAAAAAAEDRR